MSVFAGRFDGSIKAALADLRVSGDSLWENLGRVLGPEREPQAVGPEAGAEIPSPEAVLEGELGIRRFDVEALEPEPDALRALPAESARTLLACPLSFRRQGIQVAVVDPLDPDLLADLRLLTGLPVFPVAAERPVLERLLARHYKGGGPGSSKTPGTPAPHAREGGAPETARPRSGSATLLAEPAVVRLVREILSDAIHSGSSDVHFEPFEREMKVRLRQDGVLRVHRTINARSKAEVVSRLKVMAGLDIAEKRRPQDGRIRFQEGSEAVDVRVSTLPTEHGEKVVLRILDRSAVPLNLSSLGLYDEGLALLERTLRLPYGLILVTGPTGAGKTTTLYSALTLVRSPEINVVTVEDPIEYKLEGITQTAVKNDIDFTFAAALRTILRQDPNVIMVGEIRDRETAEIAVRAALTGHLVLSTLHTNDAPSAVTRLMDMGIEPFLISSALSLVVAQRLVRRLCPWCRSPLSEDHPLRSRLELAPEAPAFEGKGCPHCRRSGYSGRLGLFEILPVDETLRRAIAERKDAGILRRLAEEAGMAGLRRDGLLKASQGLTSLDEVLRETA